VKIWLSIAVGIVIVGSAALYLLLTFITALGNG